MLRHIILIKEFNNEFLEYLNSFIIYPKEETIFIIINSQNFNFNNTELKEKLNNKKFYFLFNNFNNINNLNYVYNNYTHCYLYNENKYKYIYYLPEYALLGILNKNLYIINKDYNYDNLLDNLKFINNSIKVNNQKIDIIDYVITNECPTSLQIDNNILQTKKSDELDFIKDQFNWKNWLCFDYNYESLDTNIKFLNKNFYDLKQL